VSRYINSLAEFEEEEEEGEESLIDKEKIRRAQQFEFGKILKEVKERENEDEVGYKIRDNMLCFENESGLKIVLPYRLRAKVIRLFHTLPMEGAHLGVTRTADNVKSKFYWPNIQRDVEIIVKACPECQVTKTPNRLLIEPLMPIDKGMRPFSHLYVYIMGPLERSNAGHVYADSRN
jgi:hypothetical protein